MSFITLFPEEEPEKKKSFNLKPEMMKVWLAVKQASGGFSGALFLSGLIHLIIGVVLSVTAVSYYSYPGSSGSQPAVDSDFKLLARAVEELNKEIGLDEQLARLMEELEEKKLPAVAQNILIMDDRMTEKEKVEVYKNLLENFFKQGGGVSVAEKAGQKERQPGSKEESFKIHSGERVFLSPSASGGGKSELYILGQEEARELERLEKAGALKNPPGYGVGHIIDLKVGDRMMEVPAQYYFRSCPYEQILAKGALNFSIIKGFPTFIFSPAEDEQAKRAREQATTQTEQLFPQGTFRVFYYGEAEFQEQKGEETAQKKREPVHFDLAAHKWSEILDGLMAYPEEVQFSTFEKDYLNKYDWDNPDLTAFTRNFINSNLNGVIFIEDEFTAAFDALEELFYKKPIFERIAVLIETHPTSPVRDELLFCLASSLDMERRIIKNLARAYPQARNIYLKKASLDYVFNSLPKAFVLKQVYEELKESLSRKGFSSLDEALEKYEQAELKIYEDLAGRGRQTRARALYAIGLALWEKGDKDTALETWKKIERPYASLSIKNLLDVINQTPPAKLDEEIEMEINYRSNKNSKYLYRRQVQFDKWSRRQQVD
ncbi:MAG TPA: tetratricopeptide repeat protein [Candidatus Saccharicenans sp.]|jgi:hypothetical protein|nr:tetratricopeptide repeat protein [Candidatus Saccharicenans sp.]HRD01386.1 tetratricopeptide repeat protein [Candidatus Saccharicenans sp.]